MEERVQKILARAGYGSRRACEEFITKGQVTINGQIATLGMKADPAIDRIEINNKVVRAAEPLKYFAVYKPRGVISAASSPEGRKTNMVDEGIDAARAEWILQRESELQYAALQERYEAGRNGTLSDFYRTRTDHWPRPHKNAAQQRLIAFLGHM